MIVLENVNRFISLNQFRINAYAVIFVIPVFWNYANFYVIFDLNFRTCKFCSLVQILQHTIQANKKEKTFIYIAGETSYVSTRFYIVLFHRKLKNTFFKEYSDLYVKV